MSPAVEYIFTPKEIPRLANKIIKKHNMIYAAGAKVKYVFKYTKASTSLGYISRNIGHWRFLIDFDFVIVLWSEWWAEASPIEQEALLFHQLMHIGKNPNTGFWEVRKHQIEAFLEEIVTYKAWHPSLKDLVDLVERKK